MSESVRTTWTLERLREYRTQILVIAEQHGAECIRVFGSVARGEQHGQSDIDFLVRWDYTRMSSWGGVGLDLALEKLLGCKVDVVSEKGLSPLLKEHILKEAIVL